MTINIAVSAIVTLFSDSCCHKIEFSPVFVQYTIVAQNFNVDTKKKEHDNVNSQMFPEFSSCSRELNRDYIHE